MNNLRSTGVSEMRRLARSMAVIIVGALIACGVAHAASWSDYPSPGGAIAVVVDNYQDPNFRNKQYGLENADLVYEMPVAPGITRFVAVFGSKGAPIIGPVRSLRLQLLNAARGHDAPVAHAGGSEESLRAIRENPSIKSIDEIYGSPKYFWRDNQSKAPYNLLTSTSLLVNAGRPLGPNPQLPIGPMKGGKPGRTFGYVLPTVGRPVHEEWYSRLPFIMPIAGFKYYEFRFEWDPKRQVYLRYHSAADSGDPDPHKTALGEQLSAANIVVVRAPFRALPSTWPSMPAENPGAWKFIADLVGSGKDDFYRDGQVWNGEWSKPSPDSPFTFTWRGEPMKFSPGQTWIVVLPSEPLICCPENLRKPAEQALELLKSKVPDAYQLVCDRVKSVISWPFKEIGGTMMPRYRIVMLQWRPGSHDPVWLAGGMVHEAMHIDQRLKGRYNLPFEDPFALGRARLPSVLLGLYHRAEIEAYTEERRVYELLDAPWYANFCTEQIRKYGWHPAVRNEI